MYTKFLLENLKRRGGPRHRWENNVGCLGLNGNKLKHISSNMKCIREINAFSNTGPHEVSYVLSRFQYDTHQDDSASISLITFCASDDSVLQLIHILDFFIINSVFYKSPGKRNPEESNVKNKGAMEWKNTALHHVPVGTVFQLGGAPSHFCAHAFLDGVS
jgi:hypothetical protein